MFRGILAAAAAFVAYAPAEAVTVTFDEGTYQLVETQGDILTYQVNGLNLIGTGVIENGVYHVRLDANGSGGFTFFNKPPVFQATSFDLRGPATVTVDLSGPAPFDLSPGSSFATYGQFGSGTGLTMSRPTAAFDVDNIVVNTAAVPEAATWAMMVLGFGAIGATARRRLLERRAIV